MAGPLKSGWQKVPGPGTAVRWQLSPTALEKTAIAGDEQTGDHACRRVHARQGTIAHDKETK
jgi:hypothetical protein